MNAGREAKELSFTEQAGRSPHSETPDLTGVNLAPALTPLSEMTHRALGLQDANSTQHQEEKGAGKSPKLDTVS